VTKATKATTNTFGIAP